MTVFFRSGFGLAVIFLALGLALANYTFARLGSKDDNSFVGAVWLPLLLGWLIVPSAIAAAGINGATVRKMLTPFKYRFDEAGLHVIAPHVTGRFEWSEVQKVYDSGGLLVFTTPGALQIVSKRCASSDTLVALKALVRKSIGPRAKFRL
jgi:YcxB-like protein